MKCPNCNQDKLIAEGFTVLDSKSSDSNWDDWDQWFKLQCNNCNHIFEHED